MNNFVKIGHRGAAGYEPENTLRSFAKALELKCDVIEFDVHLAATGEPVVIHDAALERTTSGSGEVDERSLAELRSFDAGKGERIPTLEEALDLINRKAAANIELKTSASLKPVFKTIQAYIGQRGWTYDDFMVSSLNHLDLWEIKQLMPELRTGALIENAPPGFGDFAKELKAYFAGVNKDGVTKAFIDEMHCKGIKVFVYTVNDPGEIKYIKDMGADGIFSNFPDRL